MRRCDFFTLLDRPATGRLRYVATAALAVAAGVARAAVQLVSGVAGWYSARATGCRG